jgi:hypothetical protein
MQLFAVTLYATSRSDIGHHNPAGNFFTVRAIKDRVISRLDPPPAVKGPKPENCL